MIKDNISEILNNWYFNKDSSAKDLTDIEFKYLLSCLDFELKSQVLENGIKIYFLKDLQGGNLGNIEQDIFYCEYEKIYGLDNLKQQEKNNWEHIKDSIIVRLEIYLYDYFERDN